MHPSLTAGQGRFEAFTGTRAGLLSLDHDELPAQEQGTPPSEKTAGVQRGRPFKPGQSGNPDGRPKGARNRSTIAAEALLDGEAEALTRKAIELALAGEPTALRLCMERLLPARRDRPVSLELPSIQSAGDVCEAINAVLVAVGDGEVTPAEAAAVAKLIDTAGVALRAKAFGSSATPTISISFVAGKTIPEGDDHSGGEC
jgi:hypothetical protein